MALKKKVVIIVVLFFIAVGIYFISTNFRHYFFKPSTSKLPTGSVSQDSIETFAQNLVVPWEIAFLPEGDALVTERSGTLKRIGKNNQSLQVEGVQHTGEGGLLGLALHPDFKSNNFIYLYVTTRTDKGLTNRVERYEYVSDRLQGKTIILSDIPGATYHDGGRIAFGPDKLLYITTGDAGNDALAQDINSLAGKILRLKDNGDIPESNPHKNAVYSYGHRNPQGLAWDKKGQLWSTEHGRSGSSSGFDELNLITIGGNYGWPIYEGDKSGDGYIKPVVHSGEKETWAPASLAYRNNSLYFGGLRGESLYRADIDENNLVTLTASFRSKYGRIRAVSIGPENKLYFSTSNTDGRGNTNSNDDKILRFVP